MAFESPSNRRDATSEPIVPAIICRRCRASLDASDNYCRRCGMPTAQLTGLSGNRSAVEPSGAGPAFDPSAQPRWWEGPWVVLALLFLVLGPLALPLLWRSRRFTLLWKVVLTVLVTVMTIWLCWKIWVDVQQLLRELQKLPGF